MEIGEDQHEEVVDIFQRTAAFDSIEIFNDYAGLPRVFQARKKAVSSLGK
jgi:methylase of polypeptide subunit release factors